MSYPTPNTAEGWRIEGNKFYQLVSEYTNPDAITNLQMSIYCYRMSRRLSNSTSETASAFKNLAHASLKLATATPGAEEKGKYFKESLKHFDEAFAMGKQCKEQAWIEEILASSRSCCENMFCFLQAATSNVFKLVEEVAHMILTEDIKAYCFYSIAMMHFQFGINAIESRNYTECLNHMKECYFPLSEAARVGAGMPDVQEFVNKLHEDVNRHTRLAKARDSRDNGDALCKYINENHYENTEMVWQVVEYYKYSIWLFHDLDIKEEAITHSRLGHFCDKVLMIPFEAKEYFKMAIELAQSLRPVVTSEEWFQSCTETLKIYQEKTLMQEQEKEKNKKMSVLIDLQPELSKLELKKDEPYNTFLVWLYQQFPPINSANKLDLVQRDKEEDLQVKYRSLRNAINHYHPDRINEAVYGLKKKVLYEEITKCLTMRYEQVKAEKLG